MTTLRVAWVGESPEWLETGPAADELADVELGRAPASADVVHVAGLKQLRALRSVSADTAVVLDLSPDEQANLGVMSRRRAAAADMIVVESLAELARFRAAHPALAARSMVVRPPLDLERNAPLAALQTDHDARIKRFRRFHRFGTPALLFAGPYTEAGGLDIALEAAYELRERTPEIRFAAIPAGPVDRRYLDRCERRALAFGHRCIIEWEANPDEVPYWYALASVVCLPSRGRVRSRTPQLGAAAARPFVGSELEPLTEDVVDGDTGFLTPAGDLDAFVAVLEGLIGDVEEADRLGAAARRRVEEELSPEVAARRLRRVWSDAIENSRRRADR